ncbi:DEAD-domain-containing protein [Aspergillus sclerotioniger CBS 115572]|uniref:ATP-dependent RNA helicase n=1 Tax=Aspergillus sclerotioniger CBS 115572 TaxID=1450535 RepID=A0A317X8W7_9EURO|nr:DEAD-domain-containing protein [Aspergillus sclerotioniger CBS 115572]PWY94047.1 DEAD-domain-containing protein [Aspergillus sclerotioniger CBS 115572]
MLGAFRRSGVVHALRASRSLLVRSTTQQPQWLASSAPAVSRTARSLYHPSPAHLSASAEAEIPQSASEEAEPKQLDRFEDLATEGLVDPKIIQTVTKNMRIETMTEVQSKTIRHTVDGNDLLAQAKTGTGKTLAFLIPVVQRILTDPSVALRNTGRSFRTSRVPPDIRAIIISPTRELAEQIAHEATRLVYGTGLKVQTAVGGTHKKSGLIRIREQGCHILVGTPGRLKDLLDDPYSGVEAPKLSALVFDEADRLLDDGFSKEIGEITALLPDRAEVERQTLMFSATVPDEVMDLVRKTMKPGFGIIKTVSANETPTHMRVPQKAVYMDGFQNALPAILELVKQNTEDLRAKPFKAIVYLNSTMMVTMANAVFRRLKNDPENPRAGHPLGRLPIYEIHSRLTQAQRTRTADQFRKDKSAILFSSDVTARGLDFPDVTHVIQYGLPRDHQTYIHRLGRTGRANKSGEGWIFLHEGEKSSFRKMFSNLPIEESTSIPLAHVNMREEIEQDGSASSETLRQVKAAVQNTPQDLRVEAWKSQIGTLMGRFRPGSLALPSMEELSQYGYDLPQTPHVSPIVMRALSSGDAMPQRSQRGGFRSGPFGGRSGGRSDFRSGGRSDFRSGGGRSDYRSGGRSFGDSWGDRGQRSSNRGGSSWETRDGRPLFKRESGRGSRGSREGRDRRDRYNDDFY